MLRIGHRPSRDKRVTTHAALVARAFGADNILISTRDPEIEENIRSVVSRFGGRFEIRSGVSWTEAVRSWSGITVHLTMYGTPFREAMPRLRGQDVMVIIGAEKVPPEVYQMVDLNLSIGSQPHSEIAALALFLDSYFEGSEDTNKFGDARLRIIPNPRGKTIVERSDEIQQ